MSVTAEKTAKAYSGEEKAAKMGALNKAAKDLSEYLSPNFQIPSWLQAVGQTSDSLIVYTRTKKHPAIPNEFQGFPVTTQCVGQMRPASESE